MVRPKKSIPTVVASIRFAEPLYRDLQELAEAENRSLSQQVLHLVHVGLRTEMENHIPKTAEEKREFTQKVAKLASERHRAKGAKDAGEA